MNTAIDRTAEGASTSWRISQAQCREGEGKSVPALIAPKLRVLFVGINPSNCSGAAGYHFATPGNRFWPALHGSGVTDRQLRPDERDELLARGIGVTNLVNRATSDSRQVDVSELRAGASDLRDTVRRYRPRIVAILGKDAYRLAFNKGRVEFGQQSTDLEGALLWLLPNPSRRNGYYQLPRLVEQFATLREAVGAR